MTTTSAKTAVSPWLVLLARIGYAAKEVVYAIGGVLAMKLALGTGGGATTDQRGAMGAIADAPFGRAALVLIGVGLIAYGAYQVATARYRRMRV